MENTDNRDELTDFESMCSILSELWMNYKTDKNFKEFIEYNDLGLPLSFLINSELVEPSAMAKEYIKETWILFLSALGIKDDAGWRSLDELFRYAEENIKE